MTPNEDTLHAITPERVGGIAHRLLAELSGVAGTPAPLPAPPDPPGTGFMDPRGRAPELPDPLGIPAQATSIASMPPPVDQARFPQRPAGVLGMSPNSPPPLFGHHDGVASHAPTAMTAPAPVEPHPDDGIRAFVDRIRNSATSRSGAAFPEDPGLIHLRERFGRGSETNDSGRIDLSQSRRDFPILDQRVNGHPLVWLDNAATTQKPQSVIDALRQHYERDNSNIHRAAHSLAARSTDAFENARSKVAGLLGTADSDEIIFVRGATEGINLVARTWSERFLHQGDEILLTELEHHANIVPWQMVAKEKGARIRVAPIDDRGELRIDAFANLVTPKTRMVAFTHASNSLGTLLPIEQLTAIAKRYGACVLIDGAQTVAHETVNVRAIGCDFFVFSGHKVFAPTGIGAVYGRRDVLEQLPPWQGGGNMIRDVTFEHTEYQGVPARFEAGTPSVADAVGLGAAIDYVQRLGLANIGRHEHELLEHATQELRRIPGLRIIGEASRKIAVISFVLDGREPEEVGKALDKAGIAVRSGHHCAQPSLRHFGLEKTVRPSFALYNSHDEVEYLARTLRNLKG